MTSRISLTPQTAIPVQGGNSFPALIAVGASGSPGGMALDFDATTDMAAQWHIPYAPTYASGNITVKVRAAMASATTGNVRIGAAVCARTPGDSVSVEADAYATEALTTQAVPGTAGYEFETSITVSSVDSLATGDELFLRVHRDADDGTNDTASGGFHLLSVIVEYADA